MYQGYQGNYGGIMPNSQGQYTNYGGEGVMGMAPMYMGMQMASQQMQPMMWGSATKTTANLEPEPDPDMYETSVYLGIEDDVYDFRTKVIGEKGENLEYIRKSTGAKVLLRGKGSGVYNTRPPHIFISHRTLSGMEDAEKLAYNLVKSVKEDYQDWKAKGGSSTAPRSQSGSYSQSNSQSSYGQGNSSYSQGNNMYGSNSRYSSSVSYSNNSNTQRRDYDHGRSKSNDSRSRDYISDSSDRYSGNSGRAQDESKWRQSRQDTRDLGGTHWEGPPESIDTMQSSMHANTLEDYVFKQCEKVIKTMINEQSLHNLKRSVERIGQRDLKAALPNQAQSPNYCKLCKENVANMAQHLAVKSHGNMYLLRQIQLGDLFTDYYSDVPIPGVITNGGRILAMDTLTFGPYIPDTNRERFKELLVYSGAYLAYKCSVCASNITTLGNWVQHVTSKRHGKTVIENILQFGIEGFIQKNPHIPVPPPRNALEIIREMNITQVHPSVPKVRRNMQDSSSPVKGQANNYQLANLSAQERQLVLQVQALTGIDDLSLVISVLTALGGMDPGMLQTLSALDPVAIQHAVSGNVALQGMDVKFVQKVIKMYMNYKGIPMLSEQQSMMSFQQQNPLQMNPMQMYGQQASWGHVEQNRVSMRSMDRGRSGSSRWDNGDSGRSGQNRGRSRSDKSNDRSRDRGRKDDNKGRNDRVKGDRSRDRSRRDDRSKSDRKVDKNKEQKSKDKSKDNKDKNGSTNDNRRKGNRSKDNNTSKNDKDKTSDRSKGNKGNIKKDSTPKKEETKVTKNGKKVEKKEDKNKKKQSDTKKESVQNKDHTSVKKTEESGGKSTENAKKQDGVAKKDEVIDLTDESEVKNVESKETEEAQKETKEEIAKKEDGQEAEKGTSSEKKVEEKKVQEHKNSQDTDNKAEEEIVKSEPKEDQECTAKEENKMGQNNGKSDKQDDENRKSQEMECESSEAIKEEEETIGPKEAVEESPKMEESPIEVELDVKPTVEAKEIKIEKQPQDSKLEKEEELEGKSEKSQQAVKESEAMSEEQKEVVENPVVMSEELKEVVENLEEEEPEEVVENPVMSEELKEVVENPEEESEEVVKNTEVKETKEKVENTEVKSEEPKDIVESAEIETEEPNKIVEEPEVSSAEPKEDAKDIEAQSEDPKAEDQNTDVKSEEPKDDVQATDEKKDESKEESASKTDAILEVVDTPQKNISPRGRGRGRGRGKARRGGRVAQPGGRKTRASLRSQKEADNKATEEEKSVEEKPPAEEPEKSEDEAFSLENMQTVDEYVADDIGEPESKKVCKEGDIALTAGEANNSSDVSIDEDALLGDSDDMEGVEEVTAHVDD